MSLSEITRAPVTVENIAPKSLPLVFHPVPRRTPSCIARTPIAALAPPPREAVGRAALRCWVLSDLRIGADSDFALPNPLPDFDLLLVAGGIAPGLDTSLTWLARALDGRHGSRPVVMVPGSLEFRSEVPLVEALAQGRELAGTYGISLLSDESIRLEAADGGGVHVVGATLWTDWALHGPFQGRLARVGARHDWPDGKGISLRRGRPLTPLDALAVHARSRAYIEDALARHRPSGFGLQGAAQRPDRGRPSRRPRHRPDLPCAIPALPALRPDGGAPRPEDRGIPGLGPRGRPPVLGGADALGARQRANGNELSRRQDQCRRQPPRRPWLRLRSEPRRRGLTARTDPIRTSARDPGASATGQSARSETACPYPIVPPPPSRSTAPRKVGSRTVTDGGRVMS